MVEIVRNVIDNYLLTDGMINLDNFTGNDKDYKLKDLKKYCNTHICKLTSKSKKQDYFIKLTDITKMFKSISFK